MGDLTRRDALKGGGLAALAGLIGGGAMGGSLGGSRAMAGLVRAEGPGPKGRLLRFAHLTDSHTMPERNAGPGLAACLAHVMAQPDRPDLIVTGGDLINDAFAADEGRTKQQWDLYVKTLRDGTSLPIEHCLGNHDIWGWDKTKAKATGEELLWGKKWATDLLGVKWYRSVVRNGVKIVILDSVHPLGPKDYKGGIDDAQFEWLKGELGTTPPGMPIVVVSHVPILSITVALTDGTWGDEGQSIKAGAMIMDGPRLVRLFEQFPAVKLCISGHIHTVDRVDVQGVTYLCGGAVSGCWWRDPAADRERREKNSGRAQFSRANPGYTLVDVFADGTFAYQYCEYGWKM